MRRIVIIAIISAIAIGCWLFGADSLVIKDTAMLKRVEREVTRRVYPERPPSEEDDKELARFKTETLVAALGDLQIRSVYTPDSRVNTGGLTTSSTDPRIRLNLAGVAAIVREDALRRDGKRWKLRTKTYKKHKNLCRGQLFENEPVAAICTAFLIGDNVLATAAHCYDDYELEETRFVFGFQSSGNITTTTFDENDVYEGTYIKYGSDDLVTITLSKKVAGRAPLTVDRGVVKRGDSLYVIGHPAGLPLKFADGARVQDVADPIFTANLDVLGGNSGSPVFHASSHKVVGIHVNGDDGYLTTPKGCTILQECPTFYQCLGEGCVLAKYLP